MRYVLQMLALSGLAMSNAQAQPADELAIAQRFADLALACVHTEYPNKIAHVLNSDADVRPPRELTPAFYGCFDWHSAVHGHWLLARLARLYPDTALANQALEAISQNITPETIAAEVAYYQAEGRSGFERPYGLAWLLQLGAELRESESERAAAMLEALQPLETAVVAELTDWLNKLLYPIRTGEH
ncbi:MAG: DUF2891 family protein, partial [Pseudomonadota bacterium]